MTSQCAEELLYLALAEPIGLLLQAEPVERARQRLYATKRQLADPQLDCIQIRLSPLEGGNLVLCHEANSQQLTEIGL